MMAAKRLGRRPKPPELKRVGLTVKMTGATKEDLQRASYWLRREITSMVEPLVLQLLADLRQEHGAKIFKPIPEEDA